MYLVLADDVSFECVFFLYQNHTATDSADLTLASITMSVYNKMSHMAKKPSSINAESRIS